MSVVLSIEEAGPCRQQVKIEVPAAAVEAETDRVAKDLAKSARIPGFRKGKVPPALMLRRFRDEVDREVAERLVPRYWKQAAAEKELEPMVPPEFSGLEIAAGEPLRFLATVETRPVFELRNTSDFNLPEPRVEPTEDEIDSAIEDLRRMRAEWEAVERPAAQGDRAKVRVGPHDSEAQPDEIEVEIGSPRVWEELSLALVGLQPGQSGEFERREGEGEAATTRRFRVALLELREAKLPPLDDTFASALGRFKDFAELRQGVSSGMRADRARERRRQREAAALDQLIERHEFPLPEGVVRHEIEHLLEEYAESLASRGVDLKKAQIDWPALGEEVRPQAERRVRARILLDAIARARGITVGEEEFERALAGLSRAQGRSTLAVRQALDQRGQLAAFRLQLQRDKTLGELLGEPAAAAPAAE